MTLYKVDHKSRKWYRHIFYWSFNVAIVNCWLLYKRQCQQMGTPVSEPSDLLKFVITVSQSLLIENKPPSSLFTLKRRSAEQPMFSQSCLADPQVEVIGGMPMKKSRRTLVNDASRFDCVSHLPVHCEPKISAANCVVVMSG